MNPNKLFQSIRLGGWSPFVVIAVTTLAAIVISIYCLSYGWVIIFQNLFYVPIVIACLYYTKRGFALSVILSFIYLFLIVAFTRDSAVIVQALIRVFIFVGVAGVVTLLSIKFKKEEEARLESEKKLHEAYRLAQIGAWGWEVDTDAPIWTEEFYRIVGLDPMLPAPTCTGHISMYTPKSWDVLKIAIERAMKTGEPYQLTLELVRPDADGKARYLNAIGGVKYGANGQVSGLYGTVLDITDRKRAEEEVFRMAQEWQQTFDAINAAVWILDKDHRIIRSNKATGLYFPRTPYEFIGKHCWEIVHGTDQPIPECPILRAKKSLQREKIDLQISDNWFEVVVDPILDRAGQFAGAVHIVSDITERKRAEEALNESK